MRLERRRHCVRAIARERCVKILEVLELAIPEVKVIRFARFPDNRGYFSEQYRFSDFETGDATPFMRGVRFLQANESFSRAGHRARPALSVEPVSWASWSAPSAVT